MERSRWAIRLPQLKFVHIQRIDLLGQAISLVKARQTLAFESKQVPQREPNYSRRAISSALARIAHNQARWSCWFARNDIAPLRLTYEEIASDPAGAVQRVAEHMGIRTHAELCGVGMDIQRDQVTREWRKRFVAESADLSYLDDERLRLRPAMRRWRSGML